jgi:hypothetical protein
VALAIFAEQQKKMTEMKYFFLNTQQHIIILRRKRAKAHTSSTHLQIDSSYISSHWHKKKKKTQPK